MRERPDELPAVRDHASPLIDPRTTRRPLVQRVVLGVFGVGIVGNLISGLTRALLGTGGGQSVATAVAGGAVIGLVLAHRYSLARPVRRIRQRLRGTLAERADAGSLKPVPRGWTCTFDGLSLTVEAARLSTADRVIACRITPLDGELLALPAAVFDDHTGATVGRTAITLRHTAEDLSADDADALLRGLIEQAARRHVGPDTLGERLAGFAREGSVEAFEMLRARVPGHPDIGDIARALSRSADPAVRLVGTRALGVGPLTFFIGDGRIPAELRAAALMTLADHDDTPWLLERIDRWLADPALTLAAIRLLGALGARPDGAAAIPHLRRLIRTDRDAGEQVTSMEAVAQALGRHPDPQSTAPLLTLLDHPAPAVRAAATRGLGAVGTAAALPALGRLGRRADAEQAIGAIRGRLASRGGALSVAAGGAGGGLAVVDAGSAGALSEPADP